MSFGIFLAVLFAALLHASWNAIIKIGDDKFQGMVLLSIAHGIIGLVMVVVFPLPDMAALGWLGLSVLFHLMYKCFLTFAYQRGDLSRVYPIARGTAPMIVLGISLIFLTDVIDTKETVGVLLIGFGILLMARGVFTNGENAALVPLALGAALGTAGYSLSDGIGARVSLNASSYVGWLFLLDAIIFTVGALVLKGRRILPSNPRIWGMGLVAGSASVGAYWIAVWAMTIAPIAMVAALRETSVLFAVLIGILFLKERADKGKVIAAVVILCGVILMRF